MNPLEGKKIVHSSNEKVKALDVWVRKILDEIGVGSAYVTDRSKIGDFYVILEESDLPEISKKFGFNITWDDFLWEVAEKLKNI